MRDIFGLPCIFQRCGNFDFLLLIGKLYFSRIQEHSFGFCSSIQAVPKYRAAQTLHYHPQLMCLTRMWLKDEQPHFFTDADTEKPGNGNIFHIARQLLHPAPGFFHAAFYPSLFFGRFAVGQSQIGFLHFPFGKLCGKNSGTLGIKGKQQYASGLLVQPVQQPYLFYAQLCRKCCRQTDFAAGTVDGYALRFIDGDKILVSE